MPTPKKSSSKLNQMRRLLEHPRTIAYLVEKTGLSQESVYRYLKEIGDSSTIIKSTRRPVRFQIVGRQ